MILEFIEIHVVSDGGIQIIRATLETVVPKCRVLRFLHEEQLSINGCSGIERLKRNVARAADAETTQRITLAQKGQYVGRSVTSHDKRLQHLDVLDTIQMRLGKGVLVCDAAVA